MFQTEGKAHPSDRSVVVVKERTTAMEGAEVKEAATHILGL
jgi:hypothetical protein